MKLTLTIVAESSDLEELAAFAEELTIFAKLTEPEIPIKHQSTYKQPREEMKIDDTQNRGYQTVRR